MVAPGIWGLVLPAHRALVIPRGRCPVLLPAAPGVLSHRALTRPQWKVVAVLVPPVTTKPPRMSVDRFSSELTSSCPWVLLQAQGSRVCL